MQAAGQWSPIHSLLNLSYKSSKV